MDEHRVQVAFHSKVAGVLELIPAAVGQQAGYMQNRLPVHHKAHIYIDTYRTWRPVQARREHALSVMTRRERDGNTICRSI